MIPEGWQQNRLSEVCNRPISYGIVQTGSEPGTIPCVRVVDLTRRDTSINEMICTTDEIHQAYKKTILKLNDIMMALRGEVGLAKIVNKDLSGANITRGIARISPDTQKISPHYLYWAIRSEGFRRDLMRRVGGSALQEVSLTELRKTLILFPPLPEQKKIAEILSTWDKVIETVEKLIANSQQKKKALMQQLLTGKKRFPEFDGEWKQVRLKDVALMSSGGTPKSSVPEYYNGDIPWVSIADMTKHGKTIHRTKRNITQFGLENSSARMYPKNTVLYAMYASIGECSIAAVELCSSQAILGIQPNKTLSFEYLYYYLSSIKDKIGLQGQQGTQSNLNAGMVKGFKLNLPEIEEQQKITAVLSSADQEIETWQQELEHLKQEKKALMQQLLTGKRRVTVDTARTGDTHA